jgi:hypothetical protein
MENDREQGKAAEDLSAPDDDAWQRAEERAADAPPLTPGQRDQIAAAAEVARRRKRD